METKMQSRVAGCGKWSTTLLGCVLLGVVSAPAFADDPNPSSATSDVSPAASEKSGRVTPLANTTVGNARVLPADGTSTYQGTGGLTRWFAFGAEPGKTYVVEVLNPYDDLGSNAIGTVGIFNSGGVLPPDEASVDCAMSTRAPSLEVSTDGVRCVIRTFIPSAGTTQNKRGIFINVASALGNQFLIRIRESTLYGRWSTNGYEFHVELQNTTADSVCIQILRYPTTGLTYSGGVWSGAIGFSELTIPPFGANKTIFANGSTVGGALTGTLRLHACAGIYNFVPGAIQTSTYAYNPITDKFLYFFTTTANGGQASNTW